MSFYFTESCRSQSRTRWRLLHVMTLMLLIMKWVMNIMLSLLCLLKKQEIPTSPPAKVTSHDHACALGMCVPLETRRRIAEKAFLVVPIIKVLVWYLKPNRDKLGEQNNLLKCLNINCPLRGSSHRSSDWATDLLNMDPQSPSPFAFENSYKSMRDIVVAQGSRVNRHSLVPFCFAVHCSHTFVTNGRRRGRNQHRWEKGRFLGVRSFTTILLPERKVEPDVQSAFGLFVV